MSRDFSCLMAKEILSSRLNTIHNLSYYMSFLMEIREAIRKGTLLDFYKHYKSNPVRLGMEEPVQSMTA